MARAVIFGLYCETAIFCRRLDVVAAEGHYFRIIARSIVRVIRLGASYSISSLSAVVVVVDIL